MRSGSNKKTYSVKQINDYIYMLVSNEPFLNSVAVRGEVSNLTYHKSGHIYFDMKDSSGKLSAVMFRSSRGGLTYPMQEGDEIIATGSVGVYKRGGSYSLTVRRIERAGRGDLFARFEQLKAELAEMGMFDESYKKPIPQFANSIGIVTAPTGAAVRDIIRISRRRNPYVTIFLAPAKVQGEGAAESVISGIERLDALGLDVLIVGRGGGSIEDLWEFNEESLARAIFNARTPVISAVGHETDFTIADFVADLRAATPSEAAELATFEFKDLTDRLSGYSDRLLTGIYRRIDDSIRRLDIIEERLRARHPSDVLRQKKQKLSETELILTQRFFAIMEERQRRLAVLAEKLDGRSPAKRLAQGYSFLTGGEGETINTIQGIEEKDIIKNHVSDGIIISSVLEVK